MAGYQIGELEKLLSVKAYVIRYWEKEIPFIQPRKDDFGRRVYTAKDVRLLLRLRYLLYVRRFTIEGAKTQLLRESGGGEDAKSLVDATRADLLNAYFLSRQLYERSGDILKIIVSVRESAARRPGGLR